LDYKREAQKGLDDMNGWKGARQYMCSREDTKEERMDVLHVLLWYIKGTLSVLGEGIKEY
jgi:hypothetical protein